MKRDSFLSGLSNKLVAVIFTLMLVLAGACFLSTEGSKVLASDSNTPAFQVKALDIAQYTSIDNEDNLVRTAPKPDANSDYKDWIFAGWYEDQACTTTVDKTTESGTYWAKFVPSEVLSAKCQVSADTTSATSTSKLRIVSTVDSLKYSQVGFDLGFKGKKMSYSTSKVFSKIEAATDGVAYGFSPNIFDLQSEYFITATLINIKNEDFDEGILIKPYWVTKDGTKVYGVSRYARVEDSYLGIVNVPVRLYSDNLAASGTATVAYDASKLEYSDTYSSTLIAGNTATSGFDNGYVFKSVTVSNNVAGESGTLTVSASSNEDVKTDGMLVNLRFKKITNVSLPKVNEFKVNTSLKDASSNAVVVVAPHVVYMNYVMASYSGVADTSWYDSSKSTFVITTPEELFGLAAKSKESTFTNKTVYLGADIIVHSDWVAGSTAPQDERTWWPMIGIGAETMPFNGVFDGQGHTIDGLYVNDETTTGYVGMFAQASGTLKNFSLKNSYFASKGPMIGSVVGFLTGNMDSIYSKATVINTAEQNTGNERDTGGLVGRFGSGYQRTISNCWFDGSATSSNRKLGGIVGRVANGQKSIKHCLNTGVVHTNISGTGAEVGGFVGTIEAQAKNTSLTIEDCMNTGVVENPNNANVVGSVIGIVVDTNSPSVTISKTYATNESYTRPNGAIVAIGSGTVTDGNVELCSEELLTGYTGYLKAGLDFYTNINKAEGGYWVVNTDSTPTLKSFSNVWADTGWYFDDDDITTYEISTVEELYGLAALSQYYDFKGETIKLEKDIVLNEGDAKNWGIVAPKNTWTPISASKALPFKGNFDGQGHTISGIYVNKTGATGSEAFAGLFGATTGDASIKNLRLENSYIYGAGYFVGSIAGRGNGTFESVYSDATVISDSGVIGGIAGQVNATTSMKNCWFAGTVNQSNTGFDVGGLAGTTSGVLTLTVENCLNTGTIAGATEVGGLVGRVRGVNEGTLVATNSVNLGTISSNENAGNILGEKVGTAKIANCYGLNSYSIIGIGAGTEWSNATYTKEAMQGKGAFTLKGLDFTGYWVAKEGSTPELKSFASSNNVLEPTGMQVYTGWYNNWDSEYTISTAAGLYGLSELSQNTNCSNFLNKTVKLGADISLNELGEGESAKDLKDRADVNKWSPIGTGTLMWGGTFDGQGHTISGLYVNSVVSSGSSSYAGLFGQTTGRSTICNFRLIDSYIYGSGYIVGGIAGRGNGKFENIYSNAIVKSDVTVVGGFIGQVNSEATITNCWHAGEVNASSEVGGLVGATSGTVNLTIKNCLNSNKINGTSLAGGLVGQVRSGGTLIATNNLNVGTITATTNAGNILGNNAGTAKIANSYGLSDYVIGNGSITELSNAAYAITSIEGKGAFSMIGLDYTEYWVAKESTTPELKTFTSKEGTLPTQATQVYTGWYNGWDNEYFITTAAGLRGLSELSDTNNFAESVIKLGADIALNEGELDPKGKEEDWNKVIADWDVMTPIGTGTWFNGTFDGQGHTIQGLYVTDTKAYNAESYAGLFAKTSSSAKIQNLKLEDSYIQGGGYYVGSIVGRSDGAQYMNVYSDAIVKGGSAMVGGLVGAVQSPGGTFTNCWYDGALKLTNSGCQAGGLIGVVRNDSCSVTIDNCLNSADIYSARTASDHWIGGLVGALRIGTPTLIITNSLCVGTVTIAANPKGVGAIVGHVDAGTLNMDATVYGVKGEWNSLDTQNASVSVTNTAKLIDKTSIIGDSAITNAPELFTDGTTWTTVIDGTPVLANFAEEVKIVADTSWYNSNKKEFTITTAAELFGLSELSKTTNFKNKTIKLDADIALNTGRATNWATEKPLNQWTPIGEFAGTFDGQGHTISGVYVNGGTGLFYYTKSGSSIKNLSLKNSYIYNSTNNYVGSIAGTGVGTFDTIYSDAIVETAGGNYYIGGLIGATYTAPSSAATSTIMDNCWFDGTVKLGGSGYYAGGLIGTATGSTRLTMRDCLMTGTVTSSRTGAVYIGGLCGSAYGGIISLKNSLYAGTMVLANGTTHQDSVIGAIANGGTASIVHTYVIESVSETGVGGSTTPNGSATLVDVNAIKGEGAFVMTGLDFMQKWVASSEKTPELATFSTEERLLPNATWAYTGWYDGSGDYTITSVAGFYGFTKLSETNGFTGETIKLGADIKLNDGKSTEWSAANAPENVWQPIGKKTAFFGTFDGQGHTISGMYVNGGTGLFHYTRTGSTIKNLRLENSYIYNATNNYVGSIAGTGVGTFDSIYSNAIVETTGGNYYIGGLVGGTYYDASGATTIMNQCWFDGTVQLGASGYYAGGMVGTATGSTTLAMENCLMTGTVISSRTGAVYIGGLCGSAYGGTIELENSLYAGTMTLASGTTYQDSVIGAIANNGKVSIGHTYVTAKVNETGVGGSTIPTGSASLVDSTAIQGEGAFTMSGLDFTDKWAAVEGKTPELATFSTAKRLSPKGTWAYTGWHDGSGDYTITTAAGLYGFAELAKTNKFTNEIIKLGADIKVNEGSATEWSSTNAPSNVWTPMGDVGFEGTFDGQGHSISGIYVKETSRNGAGLFYWTKTSSKIQNLRLENSYIYSEKQYVGSIAGSAAGIIENVYSDATVELGSSKYYIGGIVGYVYEGAANSINNCWFAGEIKLSSGGSYAGGIIGTVNGSGIKLAMNNCLNTGAISDTTSGYDAVAIAGLCGSVYGGSNLDITNCLTTGDIKSTKNGVGTAVGYINNSASTVNITDTYAETNESLNGVGYGSANGTVSVIEVDRANLLGDNAKTNASALFADGTTWTTIADGIPVLTNFKEYGVVDSSETLLGVPLSRYRIVISEDATTLMELLAGYLQSKVAEQTGVTLEIVNDATTVSDYEIVLGCTTRDVSGQLYTKGAYNVSDYSYSIKNDGNSISVGYTDSPALVDAFTNLLDVIAYDDATSINITNAYDMTEVEKAEDSYIRVMSSNIYTSKDTAFNHMIPYQARAELLAECYLLYKPDFIGWQEADQAMRNEVYKYIAHEYQIVDFEMSADNWCPIFYRKDLYNLETADYYIMNAMHYCEWAIYSSKLNPEQQFIHVNIHYDTSEKISLSQAVLVNKTIKTLMAEYPEVPIAITGDYNFTATESVFKTMMRGIDDKVQSGSQILNNDDSRYYTWHILGNLDLSETYGNPVKQRGPIDHVSITTNLMEAKEYKMIYYPLICWAADHYPIFLDVAVK